jgi:hypothetical protein
MKLKIFVKKNFSVVPDTKRPADTNQIRSSARRHRLWISFSFLNITGIRADKSFLRDFFFLDKKQTI